MNRLPSLPCVVLAALALSFSGCGKEPAKTQTAQAGASGIQSTDQKVSYGIGYNMGTNLVHEKALQVDKAAFLAGIEDGLAGAKTRVPESEIQAAFTVVQQKAAMDQESKTGAEKGGS